MKTSRFILALILSSLSLGAAGNAAETYKLDPVHSSVLFKAKHLNVADFYGRFNDFTGTVTFDNADPSKSSVNLEIKVESLDTHEPKRDQHLKSPDFFNAKQFPVIAFKSTKVEKAGADSYKVTGDFTLHGVTKPVTVEFKKTGEGKGMQGELRAGGATDFTLKRSDYGMKFMIPGVSDEVGIILSFEGIKQ